MNAEAVDGTINAVRVALAQGLSWAELERLIRCALFSIAPVGQLELIHICICMHSIQPLPEEHSESVTLITRWPQRQLLFLTLYIPT